jgi:superfamily II DNA or RNA helicase
MFNLRYYQRDIVEAVRAIWERHVAAVVISATGTGKTELYLTLAVEEPGRVLVLVHRDYLIDEPIKRLAVHGFDDVAVEKAAQRSESHWSKKKIVFASVQSICRPNRLATFDPKEFSVLIVDEGHRAVAPTYRRVIDHFTQNPRLRVAVLTATPNRKDNIALHNLCGGDIGVAYIYGPKQAADEGWLVPLRFYRREVEGLDFSRVRMKGTDLDQEQVEQLLLQEEPLHKVCASLAEDRGSTLVFCAGVQLVRAYATLMNDRYRPGRAVAVWQKTSEEERVRIKAQLAQGEIEYVFNCDLFTEGYDVPDLARVVWAAPTASLVRFTQGTGRVFRTHSSLQDQLTGTLADAPQRRLLIEQSPKPFGQVVTYYPQNCRHQLCEPNDILGGDDLPQDIRRAAKQIQEATATMPEGSDPEEDIDTARAFIELRALLDARRKEIKAKATVNDRQYNGFAGSRYVGHGTNAERKAAKEISEDWPAGKPASQKQIGMLKYKGLKNAEKLALTSWRASCLIDLITKAKFSPESALACNKRQALAILAKYKDPA